jgi:D-lactate dehydrogenase (cytochrome)
VTQLSVRQRQGRLSSDAVAALNSDLAARFGNRFTASEAIRQAHGHTLTWLKNEPADAVVFAEDKEDVIDLAKLCARHDAPIVPFGIGSSLEGHVNAPHGGVSLDFSRMNNVLAVNADDLDCVVEPGVTRKQLNEHLRDSGLFFPIDPGTMKDVVLSLGVVAADGSFLRTGTRAKKSSAGYDLTHLFIGSEGTLGIIVEVALKLSGIPEAIAAGHCSFPSIRAACETTIETIQSGLPIARIELIDTLSVRAFNNYSHTSLPEQPLLLVEFHGTEQSVAEQASRFGEIAASHGGGALASATKPEERTKLWQARHDTYWSQLTLRPGARPFATDACVPISRLADCVEETLEDIKESGLIAPIVGHVGDGNFHVTPLVDLENKSEIEAADAFASRLAHRAIAMGGTCTGEHGVGQKKREYMEEEHGPIAIALMRRVKASFDPQNLFNPGKVFYA